MQIYFICGFSTCKDLATTLHLCRYLQWRYPHHFHFKPLVTSKPCYATFVKSLCRKFDWPTYTGSPMIWKQSGWASHKDTAVFIGDENKFQELVNEIYGVETFVPCEEKFNLAKDEHNYFLEMNKIKDMPRNIERRIVCILHAGHPATRILLAEILLSGRAFQKKDGVEIRLLEEDEALKNDVDEYVRDATYLNTETDTGENVIHSVRSLEEGLLNCDLLIWMPGAMEHKDGGGGDIESGRGNSDRVRGNVNGGRGHIEGGRGNPKGDLIESVLVASKSLAARLNEMELACKILVFPCEDACCKLTCLAEFLHKVRAFDIVGVTEDAALNVLSQASEQTKLLKQDFLTIPAVWGFIGYKHFVDICSMKLKHRTDMTDGTILSEERQMMPFHDHLQPIWEETSSSAGNILNQVSATVDLMNEWFSDKPSGRTFSAAVLSDGTFDIPSGLYFSQPVICVDHEWIPDSQHPPPMEKISLEDLYRDVLPTLESHQLGCKWNAIWISEDKQNTYDFLTDTSDTFEKEVPSKPISTEQRYELRKYLGKRNQLYPESFKQNIHDIPRDLSDGGQSMGQETTEETQAVEILWDIMEPIETVPGDQLEFLIDEYLAQSMVKYGVEDETVEEIIENEEELEEEKLEDDV